MASSNVPSEIEESTKDVVGRKVTCHIKRLVKVEVKPDKFENKVLVLSDYRFMILAAKVPSKMEHNLHYLDLQGIESKQQNQLTLVTENRRLVLQMLESGTDEVDAIISHIGCVLRDVFHMVPLQNIIHCVEVSPADRWEKLQERFTHKELVDPGPCGGFTNVYRCMCDYHHLPFMDDVAWDVDTIYLSQDSKELSIGDFDHLETKHLVPIIGALEYNAWFTKLNATNVKMTSEVSNEVLRILKRNTCLTELWLSGIGVRGDFGQKLGNVLQGSQRSKISVLDLSNNSLEDRGIYHLCGPISKLSLSHLNLSKTAMTAKGVNRLAEALSSNKSTPTSLTHLDLSDNAFKAEEINSLHNFLAQPNSITTLKLSGTECALENIFGALLRGCSQRLVNLDLSSNTFSHKRAREVSVPSSWKTFFTGCVSLKSVNLSNTKLPPDAVKLILQGVAANSNLRELDLDLSSNDLRTAGAQVMSNHFPEAKNVTSLDISDNGFDLDVVLLSSCFIKAKHLRRLAIGKNFNNVKPKHLSQVLDAVVQMIQDENSSLRSLSIADSKLKTETTIIINALGSNESLTHLDVSGNSMGDVGARMLAKALQLNTCLTSIFWDRNNTSPHGFQDIAAALEKNHNLREMPTPIQDASNAFKVNAETTQQALQKVEALLQRNHGPKQFASEKAYRLHQGFLMSCSQQMVEKVVGQIRAELSRLEGGDMSREAKQDVDKASRLLQDITNTKQFLPKLQEVAAKAEENKGIDNKLAALASDLQNSINRQLDRTVSDMLICADNQCPVVMEEKSFKDGLEKSCAEKTALPPDFTESMLIHQVGTDVKNKISQVNLTIAAHVADQLIDGVLDNLDACHKALSGHESGKGLDSKAISPVSEPEVAPKRPDHIDIIDDKTFMLKDKNIRLQIDSPHSTIKRKSLYSRRLRPQSVIGRDDDFDRDRSRTPSGPPLTPVPQSPVEPKTPTSSASTPSKSGSIPELRELPPIDTAQMLDDPRRQRPRRPKTRIGTRNMAKAPSSLENPTESVINEGLDEFFETKAVCKEVVVPEVKDSKVAKENEINKEKSAKEEPATKKKGWSPFGNKADSKGLAQGISNFFKKSDKDKDRVGAVPKSPDISKRQAPIPAPRSPDVSRRVSARTPERLSQSDLAEKELSPTTETASTPEDEEGVKRPAMVAKVGLPGMGGMAGGAFLAEMKAKRATMKQSPGGSTASPSGKQTPPPMAKQQAPAAPKGDDKENKEGRSSFRQVSGNKENQKPSSLKSDSSKLIPTKTEGSTPVPMPRSRSPQPKGDKPADKAEESSNGPTPASRSKPPPPVKPKPPVKPPKPRLSTPASVVSKPAASTTTPPSSRPSSSISTSSRISGFIPRMSESIGEPASPPPQAPAEDTPDARPPGFNPTRRRLSVKEKVAALDRNSNEQPADHPVKRANTMPARGSPTRLSDGKCDDGINLPDVKPSGEDAARVISSSSSAGETEEEELDTKTPEEDPEKCAPKDNSQQVVFI